MEEKEFSEKIRELIPQSEQKEFNQCYIEYIEAKTKFYQKVIDQLEKDNRLNEQLMRYYFLPN